MTDDLRPARYEPTSREPSFRRGPPWHWLGLFGIFVFGATYLYRYQTYREVRDLRTEIQDRYEQGIGREASSVLAFRAKLEDLAIEAAHGQTGTYVREGFTIESLHGRAGLYFRLPAADAVDRAHVAIAARRMSPDAIPRCLGLDPTGLRVLYDRAEFLTPEWVRSVIETKDVMRLRVMQDQLGRHIERDLPLLRSMVVSEYLLLAIVRGDTRVAGAVDVRIYDPRNGQLLLSAPTRSLGTLYTGRIGGTGRHTVAAEARARSGAADCSIASQVRAVAGGGAPEVTNVQPPPTRDAGVAPDASAPDAGSI